MIVSMLAGYDVDCMCEATVAKLLYLELPTLAHIWYILLIICSSVRTYDASAHWKKITLSLINKCVVVIGTRMVAQSVDSRVVYTFAFYSVLLYASA
jgi:hypothetical protein